MITRVRYCLFLTQVFADPRLEALIWQDLRHLWHEVREAGFNANEIAKLMDHANISTSQRYVRNLHSGAGEAVMLKKSAPSQQHRSHALRADSGTLRVAVNI